MGRFSLAMARLHQDFGLLFQGFGIRHFLSATHCSLNSTLPCTSLVIPKQTMLHWKLTLEMSFRRKSRSTFVVRDIERHSEMLSNAKTEPLITSYPLSLSLLMLTIYNTENCLVCLVFLLNHSLSSVNTMKSSPGFVAWIETPSFRSYLRLLRACRRTSGPSVCHCQCLLFI